MGSIQSRHIAIGYRSPAHRDSCRTCAHSVKVPMSKYWSDFGCGLHGFATSPMAICDKYRPKPGHDEQSTAAEVTAPGRPSAVAEPAAVAPGFGLDSEQLQRLLAASLKPEEIAGPGEVQHDRVRELLHWFARLTQGGANPKWLAGHAYELAYYLATEGLDRGLNLEAVRNAAFLEGANTSSSELRILEQLQRQCGARAEGGAS